MHRRRIFISKVSRIALWAIMASLVAAPIATSMQMMGLGASGTTIKMSAVPCHSDMGQMSSMLAAAVIPGSDMSAPASHDGGRTPQTPQNSKSMTGCNCNPWCQFAVASPLATWVVWSIAAAQPALARPVSFKTAEPKPLFKPPKV